jgi:O-Antigen ligase
MAFRADQIKWTLATAVMLGCILAMYLGLQIAHSNYITGVYIAAIAGLVAYVGHFQRYTWQIALLICYIGLQYRPFGFDFGPTEVTCGLAILLVLLTWWQKRDLKKVGVLKLRRFSVLRFLLLLWIVYVLIHMWYNIHDPFRPSEFLLKNALKTYFAGLMPLAMLWYFSGNPTAIRVGGNITRTLAALLLIGVSVNLGITLFGIFTHHNIADPNLTYSQTILIPGLNAYDNPYMLRTLGPTVVLFGAIALRSVNNPTGVSRGLAVMLVLLGCIGSLISGGRAAAVTSVCFVLAMLLLTRQIRVFMMILMVSGLLVLFANLFSGWINREAPVAIARPLQWVMISKGSEAEASIESSSLWRRELFNRSIGEWRSDPRIFWFGRATYGFSVSDLVAPEVSGTWEAFMESSLRRGATHNLLTDLLVTYGLIGCLLYYSLVLIIIYFLWGVYRSSNLSFDLKPLALFCLITFAAYPVSATLGGGVYTAESMWLLILLIVALYRSGTQMDGSASRPSASTERLQDRMPQFVK